MEVIRFSLYARGVRMYAGFYRMGLVYEKGGKYGVDGYLLVRVFDNSNEVGLFLQKIVWGLAQALG